MATNTIFLTVNVETGKMVGNIKEANKAIKSLEDELFKLKQAGKDIGNKEYDTLAEKIRGAKIEVKNFNDQLRVTPSFTKKMGDAIAKAAKEQLGLNSAFKANPLGFIIGLVALLAAKFSELYDKSQTVRAGVAGLFSALKTVFTGIKDLAVNSLGGVGDLLLGIFTLDTAKIASGVTKLSGSFKDYGAKVAESFQSGFKSKISLENNSVDGLKAQIEVLEKQRNNIDASTKEGADKIEKLNKQIEEAQKKVDKIQGKKDDPKAPKVATEKIKEIDPLELRKQYYNELAELEQKKIETEKANIEIQLAAVEKGSEKEFELRRSLKEKEAALIKNNIDAELKYLTEKLQVGEGLNNLEYQQYLLLIEKKKLADANLNSDNKNSVANKAKTDLDARKKYFDDAANLDQTRLETEKTALQTRLLEVEKGSKDEFDLKKQLKEKEVELTKNSVQGELDYLTEKLQVGVGLNDQEYQQYLLLIEKKKLADASYTASVISEEDKRKEANKQINEAIKQGAVDLAIGLVQILNEQSQQRTALELQNLNERLALQLAEVDKQEQIANGTFVQQTAQELKYENQRKKIKEQAAKEEQKIKRDQAKKDKEAAILQALINTAVAVTAGLAKPAIPPFPSAIAAGIAGAIQVALISSRPLPTFATGGMINGASHSEGGIKLYDTKTKSTIGEIEGDEIILTKGVSKNPNLLAQASALNVAAGGKSFAPSFEFGGIIPRYSPIMRLEKGGIINPTNNITVNAETDLTELKQALNDLKLQMQTPIRAYNLTSDITNDQNLTSLIERRAQLAS